MENTTFRKAVEGFIKRPDALPQAKTTDIERENAERDRQEQHRYFESILRKKNPNAAAAAEVKQENKKAHRQTATASRRANRTK